MCGVIEETCVVWSRKRTCQESHPLASCSKYQGMTREEQWGTIKECARCKNCLKAEHIASVLHLKCAKGSQIPSYTVAHGG